MAFYWINEDEELVRCVTKSDEPKIFSTDQVFIQMEYMMAIKYKKDSKDCAKLMGEYWDGIKTG